MDIFQGDGERDSASDLGYWLAFVIVFVTRARVGVALIYRVDVGKNSIRIVRRNRN